MSRTDPTPAELQAALSAPSPDDRWTLDRRRFLQAAALGVGVSAMPSWMDRAAQAATPLSASQGVLVLVTMDGGNDGLNTVVPITDGNYYARRGALARRPEHTLHISPKRGLHPGLRHLKAEWDAGHVAILDGVGNPKRDLSHFSAMADYMHGGPASGVPQTGWLGRYVDGLPADPFNAVSIGSSIPLVARGQHRSATALPATREFVAVRKPSTDAVHAALASMGSSTTGRGPLADQLAGLGANMMSTSSTVAPMYDAGASGPLAAQLDLVARLINADLGIRVFTVRHGGYDSHSNQPWMHDTRMAELDAGIARFHAVLASKFATRTMMLCVSEFGRRVQANGSNGTDHGAGNTLLAIGGSVRGGFYGHTPSLTHLTPEGNLGHTIDYRHLYSSVLSHWLDADPRQVLGHEYPFLGFFARPGQTPMSGIFPARARFGQHHADVLRLYRAFFDREPDPRGAEYWFGVMNRGGSLDDIAEYFTRSAEFDRAYRGTSNHEYVSRVYRNVLGRNADAGGFAYWLGLLDQGRVSRGGVVRWVAANAEFANRYHYAGIPA